MTEISKAIKRRLNYARFLSFIVLPITTLYLYSLTNKDVIMSFEQSMLREYVEQLEKQFPQYSKVQQHKILESVRALVVEPKTITHARPQAEVLADIREQIEEGGRAGLFFATAYSNWYRRAETPRIAHLHDYVNLDFNNRHLFMEMMSLRDSGRFDDEALYQFEQYCLGKLDD